MAYVDIPTPVNGKVIVYRNGQVNPGYVISGYAKRYDFVLKDSFGFEAHPDTGYDFVRFCGNTTCSFFTNVNPFFGTITAETGYILPIFRPEPATKDFVNDEVKKIQKQMSDLGKAVDRQLLDVLSKIQDALSAVQKEAQAWRAAYDGIWAKLEDWLVDHILVILEKALDIEVQK